MLLLPCPHCQCLIEITEENCRIFRHGSFKDTLNQINPHTQETECDRLVRNDLIFGCGKPFQLINGSTGPELVKCAYI